MALGTGVELEWSIVYHSLVKGGIAPSDLKKRNQKAQNKLQAYSKDISEQAKDAVEQVEKKLGRDTLLSCYHSDEWTGGIRGNPEPKTDILYKKGHIYKCSVKMSGGIQLQSGQGESTARMFELIGREVYGNQMSKNLNQIIKDLGNLPTRMASENNIERIKSEPKLAEEFIKSGLIQRNKLYESWVENDKPKLMASLMEFLKNDEKFLFELVKESMTGELSFRSNKMAIADYILTPSYFKKIDDVYVRSKMRDVKVDIRAKSRSGVTALAFRIELKK